MAYTARGYGLLGVFFVALALAIAVAYVGSDGARAQTTGDSSGQSAGQARNVIIFIGDGMGTSHRNLIRYSTVGDEGQLAMDSMPYAGRSQTSPEDPEAFVTDSAAGGTAIATGVKTFNGAVGVDADGNPVPSVLEAAAQAGKSTGLVTDSQVTDATPASFGAHVESRDDQSEIARQFLTGSQPDVILGGGEAAWLPEDGDDLIETARGLGYEYVSDAEGLRASSSSLLLGLFAEEEMFEAAPEDEDAAYDPSVPLSELTDKAIQNLSQNPEGFLLMVEGEGIDEMAHQSNAELTIEAGRAFDDAVAVGKSFAEANPDTLVIVTADHETGSLAIEDTNEIQNDPDYPNETGEGRTAEDGPFDVANSDKQFVVDWTTANHSAEDVPVTAMGPGGENLVGVYENTHTYDVMLEAMGISAASTPNPGQTMPDTGGVPNATAMPTTMLWTSLGLIAIGAGSILLLRSRAR